MLSGGGLQGLAERGWWGVELKESAMAAPVPIDVEAVHTMRSGCTACVRT